MQDGYGNDCSRLCQKHPASRPPSGPELPWEPPEVQVGSTAGNLEFTPSDSVQPTGDGSEGGLLASGSILMGPGLLLLPPWPIITSGEACLWGQVATPTHPRAPWLPRPRPASLSVRMVPHPSPAPRLHGAPLLLGLQSPSRGCWGQSTCLQKRLRPKLCFGGFNLTSQLRRSQGPHAH